MAVSLSTKVYGFFKPFSFLGKLSKKLQMVRHVMTPSIYNNTAFDEDYAIRLFERLGLSERVHHLPSELSGGEQQRVAVIRAMISRPRVLFADEPTGNLDTKNGEELLKLLLELRDEENITVVMVTHSPDAAALADRVVRMEDGGIV